MSRRAFVSVTIVFLALLSGGRVFGQCDDAFDRIAGTWRGTSLCTDLKAAPACHDEQVVYEIVPGQGTSHTVTVTADKIVDGKRLTMGVLDFKHDAKECCWATDFETRKLAVRWRLTATGSKMTGSMIFIPSGAVVRKIDLLKDK